MPKTTGENWMGTPEACKYLGIEQRTLYRLIDDGEIRAYKVGRVIRLRKQDVDDFLDDHVIEPGTLSHLNPPYKPADKDHDVTPRADRDRPQSRSRRRKR